MKKLFYILILLLFVIPFNIYGQCAGGETEVSILVHTDNWGSEVTWSLTGPGGTPVYISGGPYVDNSETHDTKAVCVPINSELIFTINDSYGDGICSGSGFGYYKVTVFNFIYAQGCDYGYGESTRFFASEPPNNNAELLSVDIGKYMAVGDNVISGKLTNQGVSNITSIDVNWKEEEGSINTHSIVGIDIPTYEEYQFIHEIPFNISTAQITKNLKVWLSNPNGVTDENPSNDTIAIEDIFILSHAVRKRALIEHYTNAGCGPCAAQNPVLEELSNQGDNPDKIAHIAYHTSGPGYDPMYNFNANYNQGSARASYYGITGVPTAIFAGNVYKGSPVGVNQKMIDDQYKDYGEFKISPDITFVNDSLFVNVELLSLKDQNSGNLKAFVVLVEDMEYGIPPGTNGEQSFPDAMRYMLTGLNGKEVGLPSTDEIVNISAEMPFNQTIGKDLQLIVFVQDVDSKIVLMAYQLDEDFIPPIATFNPSNGKYGVNIDANLKISFNENIRLLNNNEITNADTLVYVKADSISGQDVAFETSIINNEITINPSSDLEYSKQYFYGYKAYIEDFNDVLSSAKHSMFYTDYAAGIENAGIVEHVKMFPNPASEWLNIELNLQSKTDIKIKIFDDAGRLVKLIDKGSIQKGDQTIQVDLEKLKTGMYFVNIYYEKESITRKIQILK